MEPFRVMVDRIVYKMNIEKFDKDEKNSLIKVLNLEVLIDDKKQFLSNAMTIYVKSIFQSIERNDVSFIKNYTVKNEF